MLPAIRSSRGRRGRLSLNYPCFVHPSKTMRVLTCHVLIPNIGQRLFFSSGPACYKANTGSFPASQPPSQLVISARAPKSQQTKILLQPSLLVQNTSATHGTRQSGVPKDAHSELLHKTCMRSSALASPAAHGLLSHPGSGAVHAGISSAAAGQVTGRDNRGRQKRKRENAKVTFNSKTAWTPRVSAIRVSACKSSGRPLTGSRDGDCGRPIC
jgi:hypothetical protein